MFSSLEVTFLPLKLDNSPNGSKENLFSSSEVVFLPERVETHSDTMLRAKSDATWSIDSDAESDTVYDEAQVPFAKATQLVPGALSLV